MSAMWLLRTKRKLTCLWKGHAIEPDAQMVFLVCTRCDLIWDKL